MSLSGRLEDLQLRDLLQILGLSRNSGLLQLTSGENRAELLFSEGLVVSALKAGEENSHNAQLPSNSDGMALRRHAMSQLVRELMHWDQGDFSFKAAQVAEAIHHTASEEHVCLNQGVSLDELLREEPIVLPLSGSAPEEPTLVHKQNNSVKPESVGRAGTMPDVLLVDDDAGIAENLVKALVWKGLNARAFSCGKAFLDAATSAWKDDHSPLLIIDLIMPRLHGGGILGGLELVEQVRSLRPDQLCLVYSDTPCPEVVRRLQKLGVAELLSKPMSRISGGDDDSAAVNDFCDAIAKQSAVLLGVPSPVPEENSLEETASAASSVVSSANSGTMMDVPSAGMGVLKGMLQELQAAESIEQVMLLVLRFASEVLGRAVLFSVGKEHIVGLGQFGYGNAEVSVDEKVRKIRLPLAETSSLSDILERPGIRYGLLGEGAWDTYLRQELGLSNDCEVFIGSLVSDGRVLAILCGDNQDAQQDIADSYALEIFLQQAGIILENLQIRGQLQGLADLLGKTFDC